MEWNGLRGMECKGVDWNGLDWIGMKWDRVFKIDARSFQIGAPGPSKSVPEAPREIQISFREHGEWQVGLPGSYWDTLRAHLGALGSHFRIRGNHFGV